MGLKSIFWFFIVILILGIFSYYYPNIEKSVTGSVVKQTYEREKAILIRAIDGDTVEVLIGGNNETESVRLLGINTPEKGMPYSNESKTFLASFENTTISLERDSENIDKYKRKLRYVFSGSRFLNLEILELGLASSYMTDGLIYEQKMLRAENYSRNSEVGIWRKSKNVCADCIILKELNATHEFFIIKNACNFDCNLDDWFVKDTGRNIFHLKDILADAEQTYNSSKEIWNNDGDNFFMFDDDGLLVMFYSY